MLAQSDPTKDHFRGDESSMALKKYNIKPGDRFTRLRTIERFPSVKGSGAYWKCICDCGTVITVIELSLGNGNTRSCGCFKAFRAGEFHTRHGKSRTAEHTIWVAMRARCNNPQGATYKYYGGRGIKVCARWDVFENFLADMGKRPKGKSLDRYPNKDGDYEPSNCRWASHIEQMNNTTRNHHLTLAGETHTVAEWARIRKMPYARLLNRIHSGYSVADALAPKP